MSVEMDGCTLVPESAREADMSVHDEIASVETAQCAKYVTFFMTEPSTRVRVTGWPVHLEGDSNVHLKRRLSWEHKSAT